MTDIFDRQALLERVEGNEELLEELVHIFLDYTPRQLQKLRQALEVGDASGLQGQAHSLKGAAASISAEAVRQVAGQLEISGKNRDLEEAQLLLEALIQEFARFQEVLER
jgi:two-component system sensor histidine kinase/response regulator